MSGRHLNSRCHLVPWSVSNEDCSPENLLGSISKWKVIICMETLIKQFPFWKSAPHLNISLSCVLVLTAQQLHEESTDTFPQIMGIIHIIDHFYGSWQSTGEITRSMSCSASADKKRFGGRFRALGWTVICGYITSLGCPEWPYYQLCKLTVKPHWWLWTSHRTFLSHWNTDWCYNTHLIFSS